MENEKIQLICTLDTETRGLFGEVFRIGFYDGTSYYSFNSFEQLACILKRMMKKYELHIYIHNLDFDISKIAKYVLPSIDLNNSIFINNNVAIATVSLNNMQTREEPDIKRYPLVFHDSLKLVQGSLSKICKDFQIDTDHAKMDLTDYIISLGYGRTREGEQTFSKDNYHKTTSEGVFFENIDGYDEVLNEYLRLDCISLHTIVTRLHEISQLELEDFLKCPTSASLSMKVFQKKYADEYEKCTSTRFLTHEGKICEELIRKGYYGGRTEVFQPLVDGGYHYDVNSLYPYIMKTHSIPFGYCKHIKGMKAFNIFRTWQKYKAGGGFVHARVIAPDIDIPVLPVKNDNKLLFPVGRLQGVWTYEELNKALELGYELIEIIEIVHFNAREYLFKNFIHYFEEIKKTSKGALRTFAKLVQNSLYGKFGMKRIREIMLPLEMLEDVKEQGIPYFIHHHPLFDTEFITAQQPSQAKYIQPHISAYITSLARLHLLDGLLQQNEKGFVAYCDTDSIVSEKELEPDQIHDYEYGKWKLEYQLQEGIFLQPKSYYEKTTEGKEIFKFKGIPKSKLEEFNHKTYLDILDKLIVLETKRKNGEEITKEDIYISFYENLEKRQKFATSIKSGEMNFDIKLEIKKGLLLAGKQKRVFDYTNNSSKPHNISMF